MSRYNQIMQSTKEKFSSKLDKKILSELRNFAKEKKQNISDILDQAIGDYLTRAYIKPVFQKHLEESISENEELLKRLAK